MIIHHGGKLKYKTSGTSLMAATKIKLESCSLAAAEEGLLHKHGRGSKMAACADTL